jgi:Tol biopolymer transport system component
VRYEEGITCLAYTVFSVQRRTKVKKETQFRIVLIIIAGLAILLMMMVPKQSCKVPELCKYKLAISRNGDIWVMSADGENARQLTNSDAFDDQPSWSLDGKKIAFVSNRNGNNEIYTINTDGTGLNQLTTTGCDEYRPKWLTSGTMVVVQDCDQDEKTLPTALMINLPSDTSTSVDFDTYYPPIQGNFSPDGNFRTISIFDSSERTTIFTSDMKTALAEIEGSSPAWKPFTSNN